MPQRESRLARVCAELIRFWHEHYGIAQRPSNMDDDQFLRYRNRVEHFHRADLSDASSQEEIAREQQSRIFEWYYSAVVPAELWNKLAQKYEVVDHRPPQHLGEAAKWILDGLSGAEPIEPRGELSRRIIQAETQARLFEQANEFYADVVAEQAPGVGGINVLLSCSLERHPWKGGQEDHHATLLRPEAFGLRLVAKGERRDDLIDALRQGDLVVESVVGGPRNPVSGSGRSDESDGER